MHISYIDLHNHYVTKFPETPKVNQRKPIPRATPQRKKDMAKYRRLKVKFLLDHDYCDRCKTLTAWSMRQVHHVFGRTRALLCYVPGWKMLCPWCHSWVESHRNEAVKLGLRAPNSIFGRPSKVIPKSL